MNGVESSRTVTPVLKIKDTKFLAHRVEEWHRVTYIAHLGLVVSEITIRFGTGEIGRSLIQLTVGDDRIVIVAASSER
jgi:hypothetical protein